MTTTTTRMVVAAVALTLLAVPSMAKKGGNGNPNGGGGETLCWTFSLETSSGFEVLSDGSGGQPVVSCQDVQPGDNQIGGDQLITAMFDPGDNDEWINLQTSCLEQDGLDVMDSPEGDWFAGVGDARPGMIFNYTDDKNGLNYVLVLQGDAALWAGDPDAAKPWPPRLDCGPEFGGDCSVSWIVFSWNNRGGAKGRKGRCMNNGEVTDPDPGFSGGILTVTPVDPNP